MTDTNQRYFGTNSAEEKSIRDYLAERFWEERQNYEEQYQCIYTQSRSIRPVKGFHPTPPHIHTPTLHPTSRPPPPPPKKKNRPE